MYKLLFCLTILSLSTTLLGQKFSEAGFEITPSKGLSKIIDEYYDENMNKVSAYQYNDQYDEYISVYRVIVIKFNTFISDKETFYESLVENYKNQGANAFISTNKSEKSVIAHEKVEIEGRTLDQRTIVIFHNNCSYSLVLVSNDPNNSNLFSKYSTTIKFTN